MGRQNYLRWDNMLNIQIICVGKLKESYLKEAITEYSKRLQKYCSLTITELADEKLPSKINESIIQEIKQKECTKIQQALKKRFVHNLFGFKRKTIFFRRIF